MSRGLLAFVIAYVISWASGELVDWSREKVYGPDEISETQKNLNKAIDELKENGISLR